VSAVPGAPACQPSRLGCTSTFEPDLRSVGLSADKTMQVGVPFSRSDLLASETSLPLPSGLSFRPESLTPAQCEEVCHVLRGGTCSRAFASLVDPLGETLPAATGRRLSAATQRAGRSGRCIHSRGAFAAAAPTAKEFSRRTVLTAWLTARGATAQDISGRLWTNQPQFELAVEVCGRLWTSGWYSGPSAPDSNPGPPTNLDPV
jgi:hypothetical protein